jgi:NAD(P)-dependent dehydrogenase (short-subunit alcohol dehydrogenase family)
VFKASFNKLQKPSPSLIAISAPQAVTPMPFQAHVCAAKAGINMLIKCLAMEWGPAGVRINGISPGPIGDTEGMRRLAPTKEAEEAYTRMIPLRRAGTKDEIAALAMYLCSDAAQYMTGAIYNCDGGSELGDASVDALTSWKA